MKFIQSYYTDIGIKRKTNQDSVILIKADTDFGEVLLAGVCDGMGGHQYGELASKTIVKKLERWFKVEFPAILYNGITEEIIKKNWNRVLKECNEELVDFGEENGIELGSTVTLFLFVQSRYYIAHVGDSRGYAIRKEEVYQITQDHSLIADEVRRGKLTELEAKNDKRKNILLECVGITRTINIDFYSGNIERNTCYLACSDGFWHKLSDRDLIYYLQGSQFNDNKMIRMHLNYLVEQVKNRGEKDNISAIGVVPMRGMHNG